MWRPLPIALYSTAPKQSIYPYVILLQSSIGIFISYNNDKPYKIRKEDKDIKINIALKIVLNTVL